MKLLFALVFALILSSAVDVSRGQQQQQQQQQRQRGRTRIRTRARNPVGRGRGNNNNNNQQQEKINPRQQQQQEQGEHYYGAYVGDFVNRFHGITGKVYAVDSRTLFVKGFSYDGQGPDAYFYAGDSERPSSEGFLIANEKGSTEILEKYSAKNIVLTLPGGKTLKDVKWLSVWCRAFDVNFGELFFPERLQYPRPQKIDPFTGIHDVKSEKIVVVDAQTFLIPAFSYDGSAPDAHFWAGKGNRPGPEGNYIADENGSDDPLKRYVQ